MDKRMIAVAEAIKLLNKGERIHTFRNPGGILIGADHDRESLLKKINKYADTLQIAGDMARGMKHGLILEDESGYLFIETNQEKLNSFDQIDKSADAVYKNRITKYKLNEGETYCISCDQVIKKINLNRHDNSLKHEKARCKFAERIKSNYH